MVPAPSATFGAYAARVNGTLASNTYSSLSQTCVWNASAINFAWAAVLQDAGHPEPAQPFFSVVLKDVTKGIELYNQTYNVSNYATLSGKAIHDGYFNWKYTDWNIEHLDTSTYIGDTLTVEILAGGCDFGAHSGYVYVDNFTADAIFVTSNLLQNSSPINTPINADFAVNGAVLTGGASGNTVICSKFLETAGIAFAGCSPSRILNPIFGTE